jgi:hypothetical protein
VASACVLVYFTLFELMRLFVSRLTGREKSPPLVIFHESRMAGPFSYDRGGDTRGYMGEEDKNTEKAN